MIKEYLTQLSQELKLKPTTVKTKEVGVFEFEVDPLTKVELAEYELGITLKTELCETPTQDTGELYAKMMDANVFGIGTFGSVLGMSEDGAARHDVHGIQTADGIQQGCEAVFDDPSIRLLCQRDGLRWIPHDDGGDLIGRQIFQETLPQGALGGCRSLHVQCQGTKAGKHR